MDISLIVSNILNPPILFFFLGMTAVLVKSDLEIPAPIPKLFSLYLLFAIGFKGGVELIKSGITQEVLMTMLAAVLMACFVPVYTFFVLKLKLDTYDAAAIAATYGSISAVTFITAGAFLSELRIDFDGYMVAALALMESPAIIVGLILVNLFAKEQGDRDFSWSEVLREAFLNSSVFLLVGSLLIGVLTGEHGWQVLEPFTQGLFYGVLTFFLLDMGLVAAKRIKDLQKTGLREAFLNSSVFLLVGSLLIGVLTGEHGWQVLEPFTQGLFYGVLTFFLLDMGLVAAKRIKDLQKTGFFLIGFAILIPVVNAGIGLAIAKFIGMGVGNALLFAVLCASASYIAVPAAMRLTVPEANPSLYISTALAVTFPFNIIVGIPLYLYVINLFWT